MTDSIVDEETGNMRVSAFGLDLSVYQAGEFKDDEGATKQFDAGQKLKVGSFSLRLTALQLLGLIQLLHHPEISLELKSRAAAEMSATTEMYERIRVE